MRTPTCPTINRGQITYTLRDRALSWHVVLSDGNHMSDVGKNAAIAELRREVGFGCPVCRSPFLTWHHFDPPVHGPRGTGMHWRPEGIIAMCPICHPDADEKGGSAGAYSTEELRAMKKSHRW